MTVQSAAEFCESLGPHTPSLASSPDAIAYGEPDDHLRLAVLLASRSRGGDSRPDEMASCLNPHTSWPTRAQSLRTLLQAGEGFRVADPDALYQGTLTVRQRWMDTAFSRERDEMLRLLVEVAASRPGCIFIRTNRCDQVTTLLEDAGLPVRLEATRASSDEPAVMTIVHPELRGIGRWLIEEHVLTVKGFERLIDDSGMDQAAPLVAIAYDVLPREARRLALSIAAVRHSLELNGGCGPFPWDGVNESSPVEVGAEALQFLRRAGLVTPGPHGTVRMPRLVRQYLKRHAVALDRDRWKSEVSWLAERQADAEDPDVLIEAHNHAIEAGLVELAFATGRYYTTDLRTLAYSLSTSENRHDEAARVYRRILDVDDEDAYAWEYYAYNLARSQPGSDDILAGFERAHQLEPSNPLYHGRLVACRAQSGEPVFDEFNRSISRYLTLHDEAASFFARPVLRTLQHRRSPELTHIQERWGNRLRRFEELQKYLEPR